jgi:hypothetical protein
MAGDIPGRSQYDFDIPTAVTFLLAGLGLGSILTLLFASRFEQAMLIPSGATERSPQ